MGAIVTSRLEIMADDTDTYPSAVTAAQAKMRYLSSLFWLPNSFSVSFISGFSPYVTVHHFAVRNEATLFVGRFVLFWSVPYQIFHFIH